MARIADIYADLVVWAREMLEDKKAEEYLRIGLKVDPQNRRLLDLRNSAAGK